VRLYAAFLFLAWTVALVPACGGNDLPALEGGEELEVPTHPDWDDGPAAIAGGEVVFDSATGCVFLDSRFGYRSLAVWPHGTRATQDPFRIVLSDGREIREGDYVEGSGGGYGFDVDAPAACLDDESLEALNWAEELVIRPSAD
jgi:hypothetical protein